MRQWRIMTWLILVFNVLMLAWLIFGVGGAANTSNCANQAADMQNACKAGSEIGAGIGAILVIGLWVAGDVILGVLWLVTNRGKRDCQVCGATVKKGVMVCRKCGYDFRLGRIPEQSAVS